MSIAILGASGGLGGHLVTTALNRGHGVHALTRNPRRIRRANEALTVFRGDVETGEGIEPFLSGCRQIIWAVRTTRPALAVENLLKAIGKRRVDRLVFVSRLGVGESGAQARRASGLVAQITPRLRTGLFADLERAEDLLRASPVPHVVLRATRLTDDLPGADVVVMGPSGVPPSRVARVDLARFVLNMIEQPGWNQTEVTVGARRG